MKDEEEKITGGWFLSYKRERKGEKERERERGIKKKREREVYRIRKINVP